MSRNLNLSIKHLFAVISFVAANLVGFAQNETDELGRKQGPWQGTYEDGTVRYRGQFKDDKPVGEFFHYDPKGTLKSRMTYVTGNDTVQAIMYNGNGSKAATGGYLNQKKEGIWYFWDGNDRVLAIEIFHQGMQHGESFHFYPSGQVSKKTKYLNGVETGLIEEFYTNKNPKRTVNVVAGIPDGVVKVYHENGKLYVKGHYDNGVREDIWKYFLDDGTLAAEVEYDNGVEIRKDIFVEVTDPPVSDETPIEEDEEDLDP